MPLVVLLKDTTRTFLNSLVSKKKHCLTLMAGEAKLLSPSGLLAQGSSNEGLIPAKLNQSQTLLFSVALLHQLNHCFLSPHHSRTSCLGTQAAFLFHLARNVDYPKSAVSFLLMCFFVDTMTCWIPASFK